jgi:DNA-binding NarL/FixJ family response regulator
MLAPLDSPIVCPITVGRAPHLDAIERLVDHLLNGSGQTLLVAGEAGIGKSRLVAETRTRAAQRGALVLQGQCFETDRSLPYAPFVDLLRGFVSSGAADVRIQRTLAELVEAPAPVQPASNEPEHQKRRLFHALTGLVGELSTQQPLLVVVEDVHWADETSLELLRALARSAAHTPLLLLLSYRSDEVDAGLSGLLTALDRERLSVELRLERLSVDELDTMLGAIFQSARAGRTEFHEMLYGLTEGNPFFVEEVLRSLVGAGDIFQRNGAWTRKPLDELRVPRSVDDAVRRRSAQLSATARATIAVAAVAGRRFDFELLAALTACDEPSLLAIVKELIAAGLVVEESADQLAFRHALTRQAVYAGLLARERRGLHRRVAEALEQLGRASLDDAVADLAYHYAEAGLPEPALRYARRAGERALRMYAPHAALEQLTRASDATRQLGTPIDPELLRLRGQANDLIGDFEAASTDFASAREAARAANNREAEWRALLDLSLLWAGRDYDGSSRYAIAALQLARAIGDPRLIADSLNRVGNWYMNTNQLAESVANHQEALALFEQIGDERGRAETLDLLGMASSSNPERCAAYYAQAIPLLRKLDDRPRLVTSLIMRMVSNGAYLYDTVPVPTNLVSREEATASADEALRIVREMEWPAGESFVQWEMGLWLGPQGAWGRALRHAQAGLDIATQIDHRQWIVGGMTTVGALYLDMLALEAAAVALTDALRRARAVGSENFATIASGALAGTRLAQRRLDDAAALLDTVVDDDPHMQAPGLRWSWANRAELLMLRGDLPAALAIVDRLIATAGPGVAARVWHARGDILAALGRIDEAVEVLRAAVATADDLGARARLWRIQASLARALRSLGRREEADNALNVARAVIADLALEIDDDALRANFLRQAATIVPPPAQATPARVQKERFGGLTGRERQVAGLIARGLSNRAIADELVVGERTVESYVGNILSKLGFNSRTQVAAWAVQVGLAD